MGTVEQMSFPMLWLIFFTILIFVEVLALFLHVASFKPLEVILLVAFPLFAYLSALPAVSTTLRGFYPGLAGSAFATARVFDVPIFHLEGSIIGFNLVGFFIPVVITVKMLVQRRVAWREFLIVAGVTAGVSYLYSMVIPGVGVVIYLSAIPSILAAGVAFLLGKLKAASTFKPALLSYAGATIGVLVGADLLNLYRLVTQHVDNPVFISIGGGSALDAIFLAGIVALLADVVFRSQEENVLQSLANLFRGGDQK